MKELDITKDEVVDFKSCSPVSNKPGFMKGINALYNLKE
jgi:hypothetical protein